MIISPKELVDRLSKKVIGQEEAKKSLAIALKNRWRENQLDSNESKFTLPKNVLMVGSKGVGKSTLVREAAEILNAPYVKVYAPSYMGKDVSDIIFKLSEKAYAKLDSFKTNLDSSEAQFNFKYDVEEAKKMLKEITKVMKPLTNRKYTTFKEVYNDEQKQDYITKAKYIDPRLNNIKSPFHIAILMLSDEILPMEIDCPFIDKAVLVKARMGFIDTVKRYKSLFKVDDSYRELLKLTVKGYVEKYGIVHISDYNLIYGNSSKLEADIQTLTEGLSILTPQGRIDSSKIIYVLSGDMERVERYDNIPLFIDSFPIKTILNPLTADDLYKVLKDSTISPLTQYIRLLEVDDVTVKIKDDAIREIAELANMLNDTFDYMGRNALVTTVYSVFTIIAFDKLNKNTKKHIKINIDKDYIKEISKEVLANNNIFGVLLPD